MQQEFKKVKKKIVCVLNKNGIRLEKLVFFGSRARGDFDEWSDYDILVITENALNMKEKINISEKIRDELVKLRIASDIIMKSLDEVEYYRKKIGSVVREALKERITL